MATLAIRGHSTRGSEVIALLEMLGGKNIHKATGNKKIWYVLSGSTIDPLAYIYEEKGFTLEEFLEKFPYKVGDKVMIDPYPCTIVGCWWDESVDEIAYCVKGIDFQKTTYVKDLQPYKEQETMKNTRVIINDNGDKVSLVTLTSETTEIEVGNNYEIKEVNGKYYAVKKKPKYPTTYEQCCEVLGIEEGLWFVYEDIDGNHINPACISNYRIRRLDLYHNLEKLFICRDAYWKIAGDEMGLGKPWEPNWTDSNDKFTIQTFGNGVGYWCTVNTSRLFAFPTREMRDAFYENFKDLIEQCKELL